MTVTINGTNGVTTPEVVLDNSAADGAQVVLKSSGYSDWNLDNYSGRLRGYYGSTEYWTVNASGNVGIGTSSPATKADIVGASGVTSFTGTSFLGLQVRGATSTNDYSGIGFSTNGQGSPTAKIGAYFSGSGSYLQFGTSNSYGSGVTNTAMTIDFSGNVGIGTSSPGYKFVVQDSSGETIATLNNTSSNGKQYALISGGSSGAYGGGRYGLYSITDATDLMAATSNTGSTAGGTTGKGIGFSHAGMWLDRGWGDNPSITVCSTNGSGNTSQGTLRIHGTNATWASYPSGTGSDFSCNLQVDGTISSSDRRKKKDIQDINNALEIVTQLKGVSYYIVNSNLEVQTHMSDAGGRKYGFIAQDTQAVAPELTVEFTGEVAQPKPNGWCDAFGVDYGAVSPLLVEAIKAQQAIINAQQAALTALTARVTALENQP